MTFLGSTTKPILLFMPILFISFLLVILSQVSVVEGDCKQYINDTFVIGVPGKASFKSFVKIMPPSSPKANEKKNYSGYCIAVFEAALKELGCNSELFKYKEFDGTYDELVQNVNNKRRCRRYNNTSRTLEAGRGIHRTIHGIGRNVGASRRPGPKAGIFLDPFTTGMWLATAAVLVYTMFIVWFIECQSKNEEFCGPLSNQLGNALWFTFSSLFLAHRERIQSNYARIVVVVWLFLALVLTQSYTANLTSMLTVSRLRPKIRSLTGENIGCDKNAFMGKYMEAKLNITNTIITIEDEDEYLARFKNGSISAAFLENPYAKAFVNKHCRNFTLIPTKYSFGGFGFIFQKKYSPLAADISKAILQLSQQGELKRLEKKWLTPHNECSQSQTMTEDIDSLGLEHSETRTDDVDSLDLLSFRGLFLFSVATSSVCFLLFLGHLLKDYIYRSPQPLADVNENIGIVSNKGTAITDCIVQY